MLDNQILGVLTLLDHAKGGSGEIFGAHCSFVVILNFSFF